MQHQKSRTKRLAKAQCGLRSLSSLRCREMGKPRCKFQSRAATSTLHSFRWKMGWTAGPDPASFAAGDHRRAAPGREPPGPPVPIAGNAKECRSNHNANDGCVNEHRYGQRKPEHLDHQEVPERECRK